MTTETMAARYTDPFLNALMYSHQITVRGELWYNNALVGPLSVAAGSVDGDRSNLVRRTARVTLDPSTWTSTVTGPRLNPYGSRVKLWRGIHYPNGSVDEVQVFYGRIDSVDYSFNGVDLTCSGLGADVVDSRFLSTIKPADLPGAPTTMVNTIKALITDALPGLTVTVDPTIVDRPLDANVVAGWSTERADALDSLCTQLSVGTGSTGTVGCEWFIDMAGVGQVKPLPAVITSSTPAVWIIDTGDVGVLVDRTVTTGRTNVFNGCSVDGEPVGGITPAHAVWLNDVAHGASANDPMLWGGPFGKVPTTFSGQQLDPNDTLAAQKLARNLCLNALAAARSIAATCIANPKLQLGDVVRVFTGTAGVGGADGMYFVQSLSLPLDPDSAMTMVLSQAMQSGTQAGSYEPASLRIPRGATWRPTR